MELLIKRLDYGSKQTLGQMFVFDGLDTVFDCKTLELPWKQNRTNISCIPVGKYKVSKDLSPTPGRGWVFLLHDVEGRSMIQIHVGNYYDDILGCIIVGNYFVDINKDGLLDVTSSRNTMNRLLTIMPDEFNLEIV